MKKAKKILAICLALVMFLLTGVSTTAFSYSFPDAFDDVPIGVWFHADVRSGHVMGITIGTSTNPPLFEPHRAITRAEFITMLGRTHETEEFIGGTIEYNKDFNPYVDINLSSFYAPYVLWATAYEIIPRDGSEYFRPHMPVTREEMAVIIYNYISVYGFQEHFTDFGALQFIDQNSVSTWAIDAVEWLGAHRVVQGSPGSNEDSETLRYFKPNASLTRAEAITLLVRVAGKMGPIGSVAFD